jgi:hypothetical protein
MAGCTDSSPSNGDFSLRLWGRKRPILLKNSVLRAPQKFTMNFVCSYALPIAPLSGSELRQKVFS